MVTVYVKIIFLWKKKCAFLSSLDILSYDDHVYVQYTTQTTKKTVKINNKFMKFLYGTHSEALHTKGATSLSDFSISMVVSFQT